MKPFAIAVLCLSAAFSVLRSGSTRWRLVTQDEINALVATQVQTQLQVRAAQPAAQNGPFYAAPGYRSALEKTTVIGVPERSRSRESLHGY